LNQLPDDADDQYDIGVNAQNDYTDFGDQEQVDPQNKPNQNQ
jgi:hypothetical protein